MGFRALAIPPRATLVQAIWLASLLALALWLRAAHLHYPALFIDEAESSVNAMTILEHGYPTDQYLGLPIYENTLLRRWPGGHSEYEFRDISYSDSGFAIYHGWLPLYAIAGSFAVAGVEPDVATDPPRVQTTPQQMRRRTVAARSPAVLFGTLLVLVAYIAARAMAGRDWAPAAALIAATIAALAPPAVRVAREARYHSATQTLALLCCLVTWQMARRGRWRDYLLGALVFALLFHTHLITFAVAGVIWALVLPWALSRPGAPSKVAVFAAINLVAIVPWVLVTGFPGAVADIPAARTLLDFPEDYASYLVRHWKLVAVLGMGVSWLAVIMLLQRRLPERVTAPFLEATGPLVLLLGWLVVGYVAFLVLVPAPSAFLWRLTLAVQGPGIVFVAILMAAAMRVIGPRAPVIAAGAVALAMLLVPSVRRPLQSPPEWDQPVYGAVEYLRSQDFAAGTRIYATPLNHLTIMFLSGMPVQSTAPISREFFEEFGGEVVIIESAYRGQELSQSVVRDAAEAAGHTLTEQELHNWTWRLSTRRLREELAARGAVPEPPLAEVPPFLAEVARELADRPPRIEDATGLWDNPAMFRGYESADKWDFWQAFFYRFVDPAARSDANLNYATRIRGARAIVLDSTWVVFRAPPRIRPEPNAATALPPRSPAAATMLSLSEDS